MTQPEALRLAEWLDLGSDPYDKASAIELRRLHEVNQELVEALNALISYTEACEGMLNASPAGQVISARAALAKSRGKE